jgi:hypothetical protein
MNMFSEAYEDYARHLVAETPVLVQGNLLAGTDGVRINVRECYPLDQTVASLVKKVTWLLHPDHPGLAAFLRAPARDGGRQNYGDTRLEFAFVFGRPHRSHCRGLGRAGLETGARDIPATAGPSRRGRHAHRGQAPAAEGNPALASFPVLVCELRAGRNSKLQMHHQ